MKNPRVLILGLCAVLAVLAARTSAQEVRHDPYRIAREVPTTTADHLGGTCPVVLQLQMPASATDLGKQAHVIPPGAPTDLALFAYNFSDAKVSGTIGVKTPANWEITPTSWEVVLDPMERKALSARIVIPPPGLANWVRLIGNFGPAGPSVLAFRLAAGVSQEKDKPVTRR